MKKFLIAILIAGFSSSVFAADKLGWYAGIGIGATYIEVDPFDDVALGAHVDVGYRHNAYLATEGFIGGVDLMDYDVTGYSAGISILPMVPVNENTDVFVSFTYAATTSNDWPDGEQNIEDGFGVAFGIMYHIDNIYVRGSLGTAFDQETESVGLGVDVGYKF